MCDLKWQYVYICKSKSLSLFYIYNGIEHTELTVFHVLVVFFSLLFHFQFHHHNVAVAIIVDEYFRFGLFGIRTICFESQNSSLYSYVCVCVQCSFIVANAIAFTCLTLCDFPMWMDSWNRLLYVLTTAIKSTHLMFKWIPMVHITCT